MVAFLTPGWCLRRAASLVPSALAAPGFMVYANGRNLSVSPGAAAVGVMIGTFRLADSGNMTPALELEIDPWIMRTRSVCARRRVSVTDSFGSPRSSATTSSSGRPPIPPAALISSRANSAPINPCWPQSTNNPAIGMITPSLTLSPASFAPTAGGAARPASSTVTRAPTARRRIPIMSVSPLTRATAQAGPRPHLTVIDVPHHLGIEVLRAEVALRERDPLVQPHTRGKDADLREVVHRLGDGNTADRALSIQVYHRAQCSFSSSSTG